MAEEILTKTQRLEGILSGFRGKQDLKTPQRAKPPLAVERKLDMDESSEGAAAEEYDRRDRGSDPRRDQVQLASHASVLNLVAEARLILAGMGSKYPAIALALLDHCGGRAMLRALVADFPATVLSEAARAINTQEAARGVLLASARAEAVGVGSLRPKAVAALDTRFDELGAAAIETGAVICELDPLGMALNVYPIAQLVYYIYAVPCSGSEGWA